jgi:hypothetical protein
MLFSVYGIKTAKQILGQFQAANAMQDQDAVWIKYRLSI